MSKKLPKRKLVHLSHPSISVDFIRDTLYQLSVSNVLFVLKFSVERELKAELGSTIRKDNKMIPQKYAGHYKVSISLASLKVDALNDKAFY